MPDPTSLPPVFRISESSYRSGRGRKARQERQIVLCFDGFRCWSRSRLNWTSHAALKTLMTKALGSGLALREDNRRSRSYGDRYGTIWRPAEEQLDGLLERLCGITTRQAFNRLCRRQKRILVKNRRSWWCIPAEDHRKWLCGRYRASHWNAAAIIATNRLAWYMPLHIEEVDQQPDLSQLDEGLRRLPPLYVCNLCGFKGEESAYSWGSPTPGLASHQILGCPACKARTGDVLERMSSDDPGKLFCPTCRMQDDLWFTF